MQAVVAGLGRASEQFEVVRGIVVGVIANVDAQTHFSTHYQTTIDAVADVAANVVAPQLPFDEFYLSLGCMILMATAVIYIGATRAIRGADHALLDDGAMFNSLFPDAEHRSQGAQQLSMGDAASFPLVGSMTLFGLYCVLKYVPKEYVSAAMSIYLTIFATLALVMFLSETFMGSTYKRGAKGAINKLLPRHMRMKKSNMLVALLVVVTAWLYVAQSNFVLNNILGCALAVTAVQYSPLPKFDIAATLLAGLFVYDIFWVFGTDVMVTVATSVDGPIKLMLPKNLLTNFWGPGSLLGLGDIIVPGFFITFMTYFSVFGSKASQVTKARFQEALVKGRFPPNPQLDSDAPRCRHCGCGSLSKEEERKVEKALTENCAKRLVLLRTQVKGDSYFYLYYCLVAYVASLVHTMYVMVTYQHAQPALLYIVPYLLVSVVLAATLKGDLGTLWAWSVSDLRSVLSSAEEDKAKLGESENKLKQQQDTAAASHETDGDGSVCGMLREFCGFE